MSVLRRDDGPIIIDVTPNRVTPTESQLEAFLADLAHWQRRRVERPGILHWIAVIASLALCGAVWWTLATVYLAITR